MLLSDFNINIVQFSSDGAKNFTSNNFEPAIAESVEDLIKKLAASGIEDVDFFLEKKANLSAADPFILAPNAGRTADVQELQIIKKRDTCHLLQLIVVKAFGSIASFDDAVVVVDKVAGETEKQYEARCELVRLPVNGARRQIKAIYNECLKKKVDHPGNFGDVNVPTRNASEVRWWNELDWWIELTKVSTDVFNSRLPKNNVEWAIGLLKQLRELSNLAESHDSTTLQSLYIAEQMYEVVLKSVADDDDQKKWNAAVQHYLPDFLNPIDAIVAFFAPHHVFKHTPATATVMFDYIDEVLQGLCGDEVSQEFAKWMIYIESTPAAVVRLCVEKNKLNVDEYELLWTKIWKKSFPKLTHAVVQFLRLNHSEVECERVFARTKALINKLRTRLSPLSVAACIGVQLNRTVNMLRNGEDDYTEADYDPDCKPSKRVAPATPAKEVVVSSKFCIKVMEKMIEKLGLGAKIEEEKKTNHLFKYGHETTTADGTKRRNRQKANNTANREELRKAKWDEFIAEQKSIVTKNKGRWDEATVVGKFRCACGLLPLEHKDIHGSAKGGFDWSAECNGCGKHIHSDCCKIKPALRGHRFQRMKTWYCNWCVAADPQLQTRMLDADVMTRKEYQETLTKMNVVDSSDDDEDE